MSCGRQLIPGNCLAVSRRLRILSRVLFHTISVSVTSSLSKITTSYVPEAEPHSLRTQANAVGFVMTVFWLLESSVRPSLDSEDLWKLYLLLNIRVKSAFWEPTAETAREKPSARRSGFQSCLPVVYHQIQPASSAVFQRLKTMPSDVECSGPFARRLRHDPERAVILEL